MSVVEIPLYTHHVNVAAFGGYHLFFLHIADAVFGIKDYNLRPLHILESFQCRFSRVSAGGNQHKSLALVAETGFCGSHKIRKHRKRYILEGKGRSVPEFQNKRVVVHLYQRRGISVETVVRFFGKFP